MKYTIIESGIDSVGKLPDRTWFYGSFRGQTGIWLLERSEMRLYNIGNNKVYTVCSPNECIDNYFKVKHKYTVGVDSGRLSTMLPPVGSDFVGRIDGSYGIFHRLDSEHLINIACGTIVLIPLGAEFLTEVQTAEINLEFTIG
jgi:hypothetical protein